MAEDRAIGIHDLDRFVLAGRGSTKSAGENARLWHSADMKTCAANVRFRGKADLKQFIVVRFSWTSL